MPRRIDIELTSARPDGSWTWRVSGAKQPKGVLDGSLLPAGAKVGDVLRAEADFELEGTTITSVSAPPGKRPDPDRLELLTDSRPFEGVTTSLVPKGARPRRDRDDRGPRRDRDDRVARARDERGARTDRPPRPERPGSRPGERTGDRRGEGRPLAGEAGAEGGRPAPSRGGREGSPAERGAGPTRERAGTRPTSRRPDSRGSDGDTGRQRVASGPPRPKRLSPASTHRNQVLESLAPEERAVAEQVLHGGIPAVRRAVQEQNARAKEEGRPEVKPEPLLALAEELLPRLKAAEWRDRAEAAEKDVDEIGLRDLRSVVAGADAGARDDESRILAKSLREALDRREAAAREAWIAEVAAHLDEGRVARALRVAGRPPDPRTRFPAELITRLTDAASQAMAPDTPAERWAALLAAVLESPVRRSVKPAGLPPSPPESLLSAARQASGRVPALAAMLGLHMPPPPGPPRGAPRPPVQGGRARPAGDQAPGRAAPSAAPGAGPTTQSAAVGGAERTDADLVQHAWLPEGRTGVDTAGVAAQPEATGADAAAALPEPEPGAAVEAMPTEPSAAFTADETRPAHAAPDVTAGETAAETTPEPPTAETTPEPPTAETAPESPTAQPAPEPPTGEPAPEVPSTARW